MVMRRHGPKNERLSAERPKSDCLYLVLEYSSEQLVFPCQMEIRELEGTASVIGYSLDGFFAPRQL